MSVPFLVPKGMDGNSRCEVLSRGSDFLVRQPLENVRHNLMKRLLVVALKPVLVLSVEFLLCNVQVKSNLLVGLELHDHERITGLTLAKGRVKTNAEQEVDLVRLGEHHELFDVIVLNLVVVCLAAQSERGIVHIDIETSSIVELA